MLIRFCIAVLFCVLLGQLHAQDTSTIRISAKYLDQVSSEANKLEQKLDKKTTSTLEQMKKHELKIQRRLAKLDSVKAKELLLNTEQKYKELEQRLQGKLSGSYIPSLDTAITSLKFLQQNLQLVSNIKEGTEKLKKALSKTGELEAQFNKAEELKRFLKERKKFLKDQLSSFGFVNELKKLNKRVYYYNEQVREYKTLLKDHKKAERRAIELLSRTKIFKNFMRRNSALASLFRIPGDPTNPVSQAGLAGLQTRAQVNSLMQQRILAGGANGQTQFRRNLREAQGQLSEWKNKVNGIGSGSSDLDTPEGFKPNGQKTKSFWNRLEFGTNIQTQKSTLFFPVTSDLGVSIGYKLNDKSIIGFGASYKLGLGQNFKNIKITQQGAGLRSFVDWKIKGSFWISGGFEMNYRSGFNSIDQLRELSAWQQSGLIGLSKVVSIKSKFFKKTKFQLLWDLLSAQQAPGTQAILFRIGYNMR